MGSIFGGYEFGVVREGWWKWFGQWVGSVLGGWRQSACSSWGLGRWGTGGGGFMVGGLGGWGVMAGGFSLR